MTAQERQRLRAVSGDDPVVELAEAVAHSVESLAEEIRASRTPPPTDPTHAPGSIVIPQWMAASTFAVLLGVVMSITVWVNSNEAEAREWRAGVTTLLRDVVERRLDSQADGLGELRERIDRLENIHNGR